MMRETIEAKLRAAFEPVYLDVIDESHRHSVPAGSESHFKVVLVSERFRGARPIGRHRAVYEALAGELSGAVHALALRAYTPQEWQELRDAVPPSPPCGGTGLNA